MKNAECYNIHEHNEPSDAKLYFVSYHKGLAFCDNLRSIIGGIWRMCVNHDFATQNCGNTKGLEANLRIGQKKMEDKK